MSLKGDAYETTEEVRFRLEKTVVLYDGQPVYITDVKMPDDDDIEEVARVYFDPLPLHRAVPKKNPFELEREQLEQKAVGVRKYLSSKKFDLAPFRMGYMNHNGEAIFVSRDPVRQARQGLSDQTCRFTGTDGQLSKIMDWTTLLGSQGFLDMVAGKYPSFLEARDLLLGKQKSSAAISRSFAFCLDQDLEIMYVVHKTTKCGAILRGQKALKLPAKFHFLKEEAEECRIPLA